MVFYKPTPMADGGVTFPFQIASEIYKESYSVWNETTKQFIRGESILLGSDGAQYPADQTKFFSKAKFSMLFPNMGKSNQYTWNIIINSAVSYDFGFKKTAHDMLLTCIQNAKGFGVNHLEVSYIYTRSGKGKATEHKIIAGERVGLPREIRQPESTITPSVVTPTKPIIGTLNTQGGHSYPAQPKVPVVSPNRPYSQAWQGAGRQDYLQLDPVEQNIFEGANSSANKMSEIEFLNGFAKAMTQVGRVPDISRIQQIYRQLYV